MFLTVLHNMFLSFTELYLLVYVYQVYGQPCTLSYLLVYAYTDSFADDNMRVVANNNVITCVYQQMPELNHER